MFSIINRPDLHHIFQKEVTGKARPRIVERAWSVLVTALCTIVAYHQFSGSSTINWNGDDRKSDSSICRKGVKCFNNSFVYDTIVVYHHLSGSSSIISKGDVRKKDTSFCRKCVKCFSNSFMHDCCISSILRVFNDCLKWRWQEKRQLNMSKRREVFQKQLYCTIVVYHQLTGSSSIFSKRYDRKKDTSFCRKDVRCFSNSFLHDCCFSSILRIFND